ncbi:NADPH--cytochrome P450 reductase isoform X1 [Aedes albopictus]|uniref:NADPH--cytochrome P450 reductase n=1 Tax=Aedes albopictus TaxID=7160 RepID=A0ABM2A7T9_AEDAL|nr:NADPH--cytochrome P450 reductase-like isoform X1 [Aedes albopictus]XP_029711193.1 NADPH--cytochrome P450 reductase-like isoform X1 [Aedes albopictus]XP_029711194.1 NADPH--cytochrome P450 reductase-like isoform X1 [Aedes albopictus]XP_029711195.1 NADPH--cytochrome P450 reductase-like isoform X1 [Aedes albopictus]XP_029711196.1 NADPH--cytochrome P450 reductase-like isoform X1 [Aedes albopictus]XP_029711197.1 NADPH--cytochrome P450 reductase-like isoform X1 [Aedes albopictus]XP_029711198.1 NA
MDAQTEPEVPPAPVSEEPFLGPLDIILLAVLIGGAAWYFLKSKKKDTQTSQFKSYSIQPTTVNTMTMAENSFIKKLKSSGRRLVVFYGSQTGTAEEFAGRLAKEGLRYQMKGMVADPEECDMEELLSLKDIDKSLAVFCLATYGEGDPTDNCMEFYDWIQNNDVDFSGLNYAVFGLGNKTYEHYNKVGIYVDKRLEELGANRVFELGLGDDDANIEDDFITWKDKFWPAVCDHFGIESSGEEVLMRQYRLLEQPETPTERLYTGEVARLHSLQTQRPPFDAKNPFLAPIKVNRELHKAGGRSCMHIEFDIEGSKMRYEAGDHLAMYPVNDQDLVLRLGKLCNADLDTIFSLINTDTDSSKKHPFPCPTTYRTALTHYLEITALPRTHILKELAEYCSEEKDKEFLRFMCSTNPEGKAKYQQWIQDSCRNIVHVLEDLPSCRPPLDHICELLPRLQPRYYSISSSSKLYPTTVHVTAVLVKYETTTGRVNHGVATTFLSQKHPLDGQPLPRVPIFIRKSQFRLPAKTETPVIMVGPGTGLAPFRGFIQERDFNRKDGKEVGQTILYFGCRKRSEDYIYEEELEDYVERGVMKLRTAFSRDQAHKVYVTHLLEEDMDLLWSVIGENKGHFYICGDAKNMATDVRNILLKVLQTKGNMSESEAIQYIKKMEAQKRYSADVWS